MGRLTTIKPRVALLQPKVQRLSTDVTRTRGGRWMAMRESVLRRDKGLCLLCQAHGRATQADEVDHIVPLEQGGTDADANLQSVCRPCHRAKSAAERVTGAV